MKESKRASNIMPRALRERDAAIYVGLSSSFLRNTRARDIRHKANGQALEGPIWFNIGGAVLYMLEDLDTWLEHHHSALNDAPEEMAA